MPNEDVSRDTCQSRVLLIDGSLFGRTSERMRRCIHGKRKAADPCVPPDGAEDAHSGRRRPNSRDKLESCRYRRVGVQMQVCSRVQESEYQQIGAMIMRGGVALV